MLERINNGDKAHLRNVRAAIAGSREEMLLALEQMKTSGITRCKWQARRLMPA